MSVRLSDAQYGYLMWTVREIACGYRVSMHGYKCHLSRNDIVNAARELCVHLNWSYRIEDIEAAFAERKST